MGFKWHKRPNNPNAGVDDAAFYGGHAIDLARAMISVLPSILRDILDALNFEKWNEIRRITETKPKFRKGKMQVNVACYGFTVAVSNSTIELVRPVKDEVEAERVIDALKMRGYELYARINKHGKYLAVVIPAYVIERYNDIKGRVIEVLCRKLERTKDEKKRQIIIKHLRRLAPTEWMVADLRHCGEVLPHT